jgi:hypothetical protein
LLGLGAVVEIRQNAPLFQRLNLKYDGILNPIGHIQEMLPPTRGVRQQDPEENRRLAGPIIAQGMTDIDDVGVQLPFYPGNGRGELFLVRKRPWYRHTSIIRPAEYKVKKQRSPRPAE